MRDAQPFKRRFRSVLSWLKAYGHEVRLDGRRLRIGRPDLETGMSTFTPDFDQVDKAQVSDGGRISPPGGKFGPTWG
jgi:hypothetical protein